MPIAFNCSCGQPLTVSTEIAGLDVRCPKCSAVMRSPKIVIARPVMAAKAPVTSQAAAPPPPPSKRPIKATEEPEADGETYGVKKESRWTDEEENERRRMRRLVEEEREKSEMIREQLGTRRRPPSRNWLNDQIYGQPRYLWLVGSAFILLVGYGLIILGWNVSGSSPERQLLAGMPTRSRTSSPHRTLIFGVSIFIIGLYLGYRGLFESGDS